MTKDNHFIGGVTLSREETEAYDRCDKRRRGRIQKRIDELEYQYKHK